MKRAATLTSGLALLALSFLSGTRASAEATHEVVHPRATFSFEAHLPSSHGYSVYLRGYEDQRVELQLGTEDPEKPYVTLNYKATGRVGRHAIVADFGRFGRIDLHFAGRTKKERFHFANCRGAKFQVTTYGQLRGNADFESIGGVVKFSSTHAEGQTQSAPQRTCVRRPSHAKSGLPADGHRGPRAEEVAGAKTLLARGHLDGRLVDLYAVEIFDEFVVDVAATSTRRIGDVVAATTVHSAEDPGGSGAAADLSISGKGPRPGAATLTAGAPFSGEATFRADSDKSGTWLGSLAAEFPGEGTLPVAGPSFRAIVCAYSDTKRQRVCERTIAPPHTI